MAKRIAQSFDSRKSKKLSNVRRTSSDTQKPFIHFDLLSPYVYHLSLVQTDRTNLVKLIEHNWVGRSIDQIGLRRVLGYNIDLDQETRTIRIKDDSCLRKDIFFLHFKLTPDSCRCCLYIEYDLTYSLSHYHGFSPMKSLISDLRPMIDQYIKHYLPVTHH